MAKKGYRILIHKDVPTEWMEQATKECQYFQDLADSERGWKEGRESHAFYRRGAFGYSVPSRDPVITFKRLVKNRRIFGVVPINILESKTGESLQLDGCMCASHRGGVPVNIIGGFVEDDYVLYAESGDIKG